MLVAEGALEREEAFLLAKASPMGAPAEPRVHVNVEVECRIRRHRVWWKFLDIHAVIVAVLIKGNHSSKTRCQRSTL